MPSRSVLASVTVSEEKVENVVNAPRKPVPSPIVTPSGQCRIDAAPSRRPSSNEPVTLIASVGHGNDRAPNALPTPYRVAAPAAPAIATQATRTPRFKHGR